jgi:hypothetical protein
MEMIPSRSFACMQIQRYEDFVDFLVEKSQDVIQYTG